MPHLIHSESCLTAWRDACRYIIQNGDGFNMMVHIESPLTYTYAELTEITNSSILTASAISDVANTIFPQKLFNRNANGDNEALYELHERIYMRGRTMHRKNRTRWGNYFLRFTRFGENRTNQLQAIIDGIRNRANNQAACYMMHVSSVDYDNNTKVIGNPCLQYVQFGVNEGRLHMTAVYRNHDFLTKALGNYIGLSNLLQYICTRTDSVMGTLSCHSIHYYLGQKRNVSACINNLTW
jgi:thymidylate synthase